MAKDIKFNIKLQIDGKEHLVTASANAKELSEQLGIATDIAKKFSSVFVSLNQTAEILRNISDAASSIASHMREVLNANAQVAQMTGLNGDEMREFRNSVQAVSDYFGSDFSETLQAANSLAKGFGISATDAMKLLRDGMVSGANANGEFLDTLREYPRYFKEAGLSAEEFVAISTNAARQGIYSDKGVDVIKEGNIRIREMTQATADALEGIGISATAVQEALQKGSMTTFDVMQMVSARLGEMPASASAVGTAIADIFGGPGEDAGLEYIKTLANVELSMERVKEAAGETAAQQERVIATNEGIKNGLSSIIDLSALYGNVQPYVEVAAQLGMVLTGITGVTNAIKGMNIQHNIYRARALASKTATLLFGKSLKSVFITSGIGAAIVIITAALEKFVLEADEAAEKTDLLGESEDAFRTAAANAKVELDKEIKQLGTLIATKQDTADAVKHLNDTYGDTFGTYKTAAEWYDVLTQKSALYAKQMGYEAQARKLSEQIAEKEIALQMNADKQQQLRDTGRDFCLFTHIAWRYLICVTAFIKSSKMLKRFCS